MKKLSVISICLLISHQTMAHGNVDVSNGSQIEVYVANEKHVDDHHDSHSEDGKAYGFEAIYMHDSGYFVYGEAETGAHQFYQLGGGKYFNPSEDLGLFVYGAYAQGGYADSNELRMRLGLDYQYGHKLNLHTRLGFDYGNSNITLDGDHNHKHTYDVINAQSQLGRLDVGFSYEIGHVAEFSYNYVIQQQLEDELIIDNKQNLHYEARLTYTDSQVQPYVEYRKTNKAFDTEHFEESAVQFGVNFPF